MDYRRKHKTKKLIYGLIGLIVIPIYAVIFSQIGPDGDLILVTFSQIGARYGGVEGLIIWGILTSIYYFTFLSYLFDISGTNNILLKFMLSITCMSLLITVFLPFAPSMFPIASETHNTLAYVTAVSTVVTILFYIIGFWNLDRKYFTISMILFGIMVIINLTILFEYGVSSLFQIVLSTTLCTFLFIELCLLEKSEKIDIFKYYIDKETRIEDIEIY